MNVIIANRYQAMLQTVDIEIIKKLEGEYTVDEIVKQFENFYFQRMILDITAIKDYKDLKNIQKLSISLDMSKVILLLDDSPESSETGYLSKLISMGIYNFTKNVEGIIYLYNNPNSYRDVAQYQQLSDSKEVVVEKFGPSSGIKIIGVKNITPGSGATSFIYAMKKQLSHNYSVVGIEVDKKDFIYFRDKDLHSISSNDIGNTIAKYNDRDVALIDVNSSGAAEALCHKVIYLLEPSTIKLNKLMMSNPRALSNYKGKTVVLNQSLLSPKDVLDFEYESKLKVFYNMPPIDEREKDIKALDPFLTKLGFDKQLDGENAKKNMLLGLFKI